MGVRGGAPLGMFNRDAKVPTEWITYFCGLPNIGGGGWSSRRDGRLRGQMSRRRLSPLAGARTDAAAVSPNAPQRRRRCGAHCRPKQNRKKFRPGSSGQGLRLWTPRGKRVKIQGVSVLTSRKPRMLSRTTVESLTRLAARRFLGLLIHAPPRRTRRLQSPAVQAEPSEGAPA
jgi:hypothetical protein